MPTIEARVENKIITLDDTCAVCNNNNYTMHFTLDEEFAALNNLKCRFVVNGEYQDENVHNASCTVPEFMKTHEVKVGLYGNGRQGVKITSTYAILKCKYSIKCVSPE